MNYNRLITSLLFLFLIGCSASNKKQKEKEIWVKNTQVTKSIKNVNFTFPSKGMAFDKKQNYVLECFNAIKENSKIIELKEFKDTINIRFLSSRKESKTYTGQASSGSAWPHISTLYVVANENETPPIKHELMHLIAMLSWGNEHPTSNWVNEGLGTFAANECNGFNVAQIYRYLMDTDKLISIDLLASNFYKQPDMIAYHQAAYIVEYLLKNYPVKNLHKLWNEGFKKFEEIYGIPFSKLKIDMKKSVLETYPLAPKIDWQTFNIGCN